MYWGHNSALLLRLQDVFRIRFWPYLCKNLFGGRSLSPKCFEIITYLIGLNGIFIIFVFCLDGDDDQSVSLIEILLGQFWETGWVFHDIILANGLVETIHLNVVNPFVGLVPLYHLFLLLTHRKVKNSAGLVPSRIVEVRNRVSLFTSNNYSVRSWLIKSFCHLL